VDYRHVVDFQSELLRHEFIEPTQASIKIFATGATQLLAASGRTGATQKEPRRQNNSLTKLWTSKWRRFKTSSYPSIPPSSPKLEVGGVHWALLNIHLTGQSNKDYSIHVYHYDPIEDFNDATAQLVASAFCNNMRLGGKMTSIAKESLQQDYTGYESGVIVT
jgi:hypothetical protein